MSRQLRKRSRGRSLSLPFNSCGEPIMISHSRGYQEPCTAQVFSLEVLAPNAMSEYYFTRVLLPDAGAGEMRERNYYETVNYVASLMERSPVVLICLQTRDVLHIFLFCDWQKGRDKKKIRRKYGSIFNNTVCIFTTITMVNATSHLKISFVNFWISSERDVIQGVS